MIPDGWKFGTTSAHPGLIRRLLSLATPPRSLKVLPAGRTCLVMTVGIGLAALNTGNNLLYLVLGLLLSGIVISGVLSERSLRGLYVRRVGEPTAFANEPFALWWGISRPKGSSFALQISEAGGDLVGVAQITYLPAGEEKVVRAQINATSRGPKWLTGIRVSTSFPFGLFMKSRVFAVEDVLLVYPAKRKSRGALPPTDQNDPIGEARNPRLSGGTGDLVDLRELKEGDDGRRIHWRKSAAAGKLLNAQREREERNTVTLRIDSELPPSRLESRCVEIAAIAHRLLTSGHEVGLETKAARLRPGGGASHERRILQALAWVGFEE